MRSGSRSALRCKMLRPKQWSAVVHALWLWQLGALLVMAGRLVRGQDAVSPQRGALGPASIARRPVTERSAQLILGMAMTLHRDFNLTTGSCSGLLGFEAVEELETTKIMFDRLSSRPNAQVSLGFQFFDTCGSSLLAVASFQAMTQNFPLHVDRCMGYGLSDLLLRQATLRDFLSARNDTVLALLSQKFKFPLSGISAPIDPIPLISIIGLPQISHQESDPSLDNKLEYPTFFRTSLSVEVESMAIVDVLERLQIRSFIIIASATKEGFSRQIVKAATERQALQPVCVIYTARFYFDDDAGMRRIANVLQKSDNSGGDRAVILLAQDLEAERFLDILSTTSDVTNILWIGNSDWSCRYRTVHHPAVKNLIAICPTERADIVDEMAAVRGHFLGLHADSPELAENLNLRSFWQEKFQCLLPPSQSGDGQAVPSRPACTGEERLTHATLPVLRRAPALILAIKALASAVDATLASPEPMADLGAALRDVSTQCPDGREGQCFLFNNNQAPEYEALRVYYKTPNAENLVRLFDWNAKEGLRAVTASTTHLPTADTAGGSSSSEDNTVVVADSTTSLFGIDIAGLCAGQCGPGQVVVADNLAPACCSSCRLCGGRLDYSSAANSTECSECLLEHTRASDDHTHCVDIAVGRVRWSDPLPIVATVIIIALHGSLLLASLALYVRNRATPVVQTTGFFNALLQHGALLEIVATIPLQYQARELSEGACFVIQLVPFVGVWVSVGSLLDKSRLVHVAWDRTPLKGVKRHARTLVLSLSIALFGCTILGLRLLNVSLSPVATQLDRFQIFQECGDSHWFSELSIYHIVLMLLGLCLSMVTRNERGGFRQAWLVAMASLLVTIIWLIALAVNPAIPTDQKPILHTVSFFVHAAAIFYTLNAPRLYIMLFRASDNTIRVANRAGVRGRKGEHEGRRYLSDRQRSPHGSSHSLRLHGDRPPYAGAAVNSMEMTDGPGAAPVTSTVSGTRRRSLPSLGSMPSSGNSRASSPGSNTQPRSPTSPFPSTSRRLLHLSVSEQDELTGSGLQNASPQYITSGLPAIPVVHSNISPLQNESIMSAHNPDDNEPKRKCQDPDDEDEDAWEGEETAQVAIDSQPQPRSTRQQQDRRVSPAPSDVLHMPDDSTLPVAAPEEHAKELEWNSARGSRRSSSRESRTSSVHPVSSPDTPTRELCSERLSPKLCSERLSAKHASSFNDLYQKAMAADVTYETSQTARHPWARHASLPH